MIAFVELVPFITYGSKSILARFNPSMLPYKSFSLHTVTLYVSKLNHLQSVIPNDRYIPILVQAFQNFNTCTFVYVMVKVEIFKKSYYF